MGRVVRTCQWLGLALVMASACMTTLRHVAFPTHAGVGPWPAAVGLPVVREVPVDVLTVALLDAASGRAEGCPLWTTRRWYPWYLVAFWLPALWLVRRRDTSVRRRRAVGAVLWGLTAAIVLFEAAYLGAEYAPMLPAPWGRAESFAAWCVVAAMLLYRRRPDRRVDAVSATIAAQALLGVAHGLTLPATMARAWFGHFPLEVIAGTVVRNFPLGFWLGLGGMLLLSLPVYLGRRPAAPIKRRLPPPEPLSYGNPSSAPPS